ncbi:serine/threonine-protein kinase ATM-like [Abrus precatorius]|uniref:Serine/threonine-protein kinase ATM-like n=1 Tax=Abrus precatorius TaxID=3816 RepID=A0A8B8KLH3_ABRPR|nr:serine/threonine-protein kinase ATM-like [Abrus precatorius]XP_027344141.1 serine/threonine-protein kinase ATM-like [Abrus precatorius]XP_027344148.1 serine/threonine-protein kinase ATM-like [Abrus precatorius]
MNMDQTEGRVDFNSGDETKKNENIIVTEEAVEKVKGSGIYSRGRRRSKYLSSPYTNVGQKEKELPTETKDLRTPSRTRRAEASGVTTSRLNGSSSYAKLGSKRFRRNWHRKFISSSSTSGSPEFINASPNELLSGLYSTAVDCMFPVEDKSFDLVEWFFCRYRVSAFHDEAELATSLVNENGREIGKHVGNDLPAVKSEKRKNNKMENAVRRKTKSLSGLSDLNGNTSSGGTPRPGKKLKRKRKVEEVTSSHQLQNVEINLNETCSNYSSIPEAPQNLICLASEENVVHIKREKIEAPQEQQSTEITSVCTDAKSHKCNSLVIDLQFRSRHVPVVFPEKSSDENKERVFIASNPESCVSQEGPVFNVTNRTLLATPEVGSASVNKTVRKKRMEKAAPEPLNTKLAVEIPDLNSTSIECNSVSPKFKTINFLSPEFKSEQPRSLSAGSGPNNTINNNRVEGNGESLGTCLLLRFAAGFYIPSKEDLMTTFCRFGPLKASETQMLKDTGSAQVVFVRSADAAEAFRSLEQNKLIALGGLTIVEYKLQHLSVACPPVEQVVTPTQPTGFMPMPVAGVAHPPLQYIKQNLQMMASVLENSGNSLSPQARAKLDADIKNLMRKVNSRINV